MSYSRSVAKQDNMVKNIQPIIPVEKIDYVEYKWVKESETEYRVKENDGTLFTLGGDIDVKEMKGGAKLKYNSSAEVVPVRRSSFEEHVIKVKAKK